MAAPSRLVQRLRRNGRSGDFIMRKSSILVTGVLVVLFSAAMAAVRTSAQNSSNAVPRAADGHPDLSGVWWRNGDLTVQPLTGAAPARGAAPAAPRGGA